MAYLNSYSRQNIDEKDLEAVRSALCSDYLTQGQAVIEFEKSIRDSCGCSFAIAVSSATAGLHLAMMALEVGSSSLVWTSANTFASTANVARMLGATVDFVDIDAATWMISPEILEDRLIEASSKSQPLPDVVILVHFAGVSYDMTEFSRLAEKYQFKVVEDAAHAFGATYADHKIGGAAHSDISVFSFHAIKPLTTGEGGAVTTNDPQLFEKIRRLRSHGITREVVSFRNQSPGDWYYEQQTLGLNYRMTDFQCALGVSQISRYPKFLQRRQELVDIYKANLPAELIVSQCIPNGSVSAHHIYPVLVSKDHRSNLFAYLKDKGIGVNVHYIPVYQHPYYQDTGSYASCPNTEDYYSRTISLPLHTHLSNQDTLETCAEIYNFLGAHYD